MLQQLDDPRPRRNLRERHVFVKRSRCAPNIDIRNARMRRRKVADDMHIVTAICQSAQVRQESHVMTVPLVRKHAQYAGRGYAANGQNGKQRYCSLDGVYHDKKGSRT